MASRHGGPILARCLDSLGKQTLPEAETIVADTSGHTLEWAQRYPQVRFLAGDNRLDDARLLQVALDDARGDIVVVTNPHCVFPLDWLEKLRQSHASDFAVIGGAIEHGGPDTLSGWTRYLADYGAFAPSTPRREVPVLAGNHISYKRAVLKGSGDALRDGYWKVFLLQNLSRRGIPFLFDPELVIRCVQDGDFRDFALGYYWNAFRFAEARTHGLSFIARLAHVVTAPALPLVLLFRRVRAIPIVDIKLTRLIAALPLLAVLMLFWSAGEFAGYLKGTRKSPR
jgi:glycosyltransferase involved in cell wall biosynthesis